MLSGSRDVLCVSLCVSLWESVGVLVEAVNKQFFCYFLEGACVELEEEFLYLEIFESLK